MPKKQLSEADVCKEMIAYLEERGWCCYQEVSFKGERGRADIVAVYDGRIVWVIEAKKALNLDVLAQAYDWVGVAHYVSIVVPYPARGEWAKKGFVKQVLGDQGIGLFYTCKTSDVRVATPVHARLNRSAHRHTEKLLSQLRPEHQTFAAAGTSGTFWTPYKESCREILKEVSGTPGINFTELMKRVGKMHYSSPSSARSTMLKRIIRGHVPGVHITRVGKEFRVYPGAQK
jgi:hypothetical protein